MRRATSAAGLALLLLVIACQRGGLDLAGSRHASLGASKLITEYRKDTEANREIALLHVLFTPDRDPPKHGAFSYGSSSSGSAEVHKLDFQYSEDSGLSIQSRPVTIMNGQTVEAGGRSFQLLRGNIFIARVRVDGAVELSQLPHIAQDRETSVGAVVDLIKAALPANPRIQALDNTR